MAGKSRDPRYAQCPKCGNKLVPRKDTIRRAHPKETGCWEWKTKCRNCGYDGSGEFHGGISKEELLKFFRTGDI